MKKEYIPFEKSVTIHEHRAPTDRSIDILNEMQEKAIQNIVHNMPINDNVFKLLFMSFKQEEWTDKLHAYIKFTINGKEHIFDDFIELDGLREIQGIRKHNYKGYERHLLEFIHKKITECISIVIIEESQNLLKQFIEGSEPQIKFKGN
jgi:hypothetical protein